MHYELQEIKRLRTHLSLTQADLARRAGVSQSLIAKVESGRLDPTFTKAKQIFEVLESLDLKQELQAKDILVARTISCEPRLKVTQAIKRMNEHGISQLPVVKDGHIIGLLSETNILEKVASQDYDLSLSTVEEVMEDAPPVVSLQTRVSAITALLRHFPLVVVRGKSGGIEGVVTKADMLRVLSH